MHACAHKIKKGKKGRNAGTQKRRTNYFPLFVLHAAWLVAKDEEKEGKERERRAERGREGGQAREGGREGVSSESVLLHGWMMHGRER